MRGRDLLYPKFIGGRGALGLLFLRIVVGAAFILHGWGKIRDPFGWMGPDAGVPDSLEAAAAIAEFCGGAALILGLFTPLAALGLIGVMLGALGMVHLPAGHPFVSTSGQSFELPLTYLAVAVMFLLAGPGTWSLDAWLFPGRGRTTDAPPQPTDKDKDKADRRAGRDRRRPRTPAVAG